MKLVIRFHVLWENQIENDSNHKDNSNTILCKDGLNNLWENRKQICALRKSQTDAEGERRNDRVALREAAFAYHLQAADNNGAEHHNRAAAEHSIRKGCEQRAEHREYTGKNHNHCAGCNSKAINDFCHGNQADILAKRSNWQTAKYRG